MDSFKRFSKQKLSDKECFYSYVKDGATGDNGEKLDSHISVTDNQGMGMRLLKHSSD